MIYPLNFFGIVLSISGICAVNIFQEFNLLGLILTGFYLGLIWDCVVEIEEESTIEHWTN